MQVLKFDNVRPCSMTLDEVLGGRVVVQVLAPSRDVPAVVLALPVVGEPELPPAA